MTTEKIYKLLTKGTIGVLKGTEVDKVDGRVIYLLEVTNDEGATELKRVTQSTFKRWWKLQEQEVVEEQPLEQEVPAEQEEQPEQVAETVEVINEIEEILNETTEEQKAPKAPRKSKVNYMEGGVLKHFYDTVKAKGGNLNVYSEGRGGVVKRGSKVCMYVSFKRSGEIRICLPEAVDDCIETPYTIYEKHSYPQKFPYRVHVPRLDDDSKRFIDELLDLYV